MPVAESVWHAFTRVAAKIGAANSGRDVQVLADPEVEGAVPAPPEVQHAVVVRGQRRPPTHRPDGRPEETRKKLANASIGAKTWGIGRIEGNLSERVNFLKKSPVS